MVVAAFAEKRTRENVHEHKNRAFSGDTGSYRGQMFGAELIATVYRKDRKGGREGTPLLASFHLVSPSSPPRLLLVLIAVTRVESCLLLHEKSSFSFFSSFRSRDEGRWMLNEEKGRESLYFRTKFDEQLVMILLKRKKIGIGNSFKQKNGFSFRSLPDELYFPLYPYSRSNETVVIHTRNWNAVPK